MSAKQTGLSRAKGRRAISQVLDQWLDTAGDGPLLDSHKSLSQPSSEALSRFKSIPLMFHQPTLVPVLQCPIVHDSSAQGQLVSLRNATDGHIRRIRFGVGNLEMEIVAERRDKAWEFVGRVYQDNDVAHRFILRAGSRKLMADAGGFFHWSSESVPRHFRLLSFEQEVTCEVVSW
jgi:hypothetical protein